MLPSHTSVPIPQFHSWGNTVRGMILVLFLRLPVLRLPCYLKSSCQFLFVCLFLLWGSPRLFVICMLGICSEPHPSPVVIYRTTIKLCFCLKLFSGSLWLQSLCRYEPTEGFGATTGWLPPFWTLYLCPSILMLLSLSHLGQMMVVLQNGCSCFAAFLLCSFLWTCPPIVHIILN